MCESESQNIKYTHEKSDIYLVIQARDNIYFALISVLNESKKTMGKEAHKNLVDKFTSCSEEEMERALKFLCLPEPKQISVLNDFEQASKPNPLEKLREDYKIFPKNQRITVDNVISHLKPQLKSYVKSFGAKENSFYLDDLREIEPKAEKMYQTFYRAHKKDSSSPLLSDLVSKKKEKVSKKLENFEQTETTTAKEYQYIASIKQKRRNSDSSNTALVI